MAAYDQVLQAKLNALWFILPDSTPQALKGERQGMLIREFQIAARGRYGAQDSTNGTSVDAANLKQVDLNSFPDAKLPDGFAPTGVADPATIQAIDAWLKPNAKLRCPVIFQARKAGSPTKPWEQVVAQGFIFHDESVPVPPRVFVSDFTGRYPLDAQGVPTRIQVGTSTRWFDSKSAKTLTGIACTAKQTYRAPFDPLAITGTKWDDLSKAQQATFRVLAAIGSVEADGNLDGINAYDAAVFSAGPYHYTAFPNRSLGNAELGAFFSYFAAAAPVRSAELFTEFGLGPTDKWSKALFGYDQRVYRAGFGLVASNGKFEAPTTVTERDWVRTWHAFHRIQHALRTDKALQQAIWPFARQRTIDLLRTPWAAKAGPPGAKTLGDVFKSEASVALLLRWHVYLPGRVVGKGVSGVVPAGIVETAGLQKLEVSKWTTAEEGKLVKAFADAQKKGNKLRKYFTAELIRTLAAITIWSRPEWAGGATGPTLSRERGFEPFTDGAPFPGGSG